MSCAPLGYLWRALGLEVHPVSGECPSRFRSWHPAGVTLKPGLRRARPAPCTPCCCAFWQSIIPAVWSCQRDRHSSRCFNALSQSLYLSSFRLPRRNAIASDARCCHSGVACSIPAGGHGIWTIVLAPVDRSRSAGSDYMSNPLRIAKA